jgi:F-type H+-transporting ATPase subunit b
MLEFSPVWFPILIVQFIFLVWILNKLLFAPLAQVFHDREKATRGALEEAKNLIAKKDAGIASMNADLMEARSKAKSSQNALREEGMTSQKETLAATEKEAVGMIEKARGELRSEAERVRTELKADVDRFAEEIVRKLVKV